MGIFGTAKQHTLPLGNAPSLRTLLVVTYSLQIVAIYSGLVSDLFPSIEIVKQISFFLLMTFIPGIYLLGFFRIRDLEPVLAVVFIIGLSIFFLFACGLTLFVIGLLIGVNGVITGWNLLLVFLCLLNILILLFFYFDCPVITFERRKIINLKDPMLYMAILIPLVAALGAVVANLYQSNVVEIFSLLIILAAIAYAGLSRTMANRSFSWLLYGISLGLLLHTSLITSYLWGWDIHKEYYIARTVIDTGGWNINLYSNINAMLSIVVLVPMYSLLYDINLIMVFKLIYPILFAFAPLVLFQLFSRYSSKKIAFLSCVFAVSFYAFYFDLPALGRQEIGMLFFALLVLILIDTQLKMSRSAKYCLAIIFGFCLIVSHYGTAYILLLLWVMALVIYLVHVRILLPLSRMMRKDHAPEERPVAKPLILSFGLILFIALMALLWYTSVTNGSAFKSIVKIGTEIVSAISTDLLNPNSSQGLAYITAQASTPLHTVGKIVQLISQGLIALGILSLFSKNDRYRFPTSYIYLAIASFVVLLACIAVPYFAESLNTSRIIVIMLLVLAPMCIVGIIFLFAIGKRTISFISGNKPMISRSGLANATIVAFLAIFLLFNTGLIYMAESGGHTSIALDYNIDYPRYNDPEVAGQEWLVEMKAGTAYADGYGGQVFNEYYFKGIDPLISLSKNQTDSLIYLGTYDIESKTVMETTSPVYYTYYNMFEYSNIYSDHKCMIQLT